MAGLGSSFKIEESKIVSLNPVVKAERVATLMSQQRHWSFKET